MFRVTNSPSTNDVLLAGIHWGSNSTRGFLSPIASIEQEVGGMLLAQPFTLSVTKQLSGGSGTVTSSPSGIACGVTCSASFDAGQVITLSGNPAAGSNLSGWIGCDSVVSWQCKVSLKASRTVTAKFCKGAEPGCYEECLDGCLADGGLHSQCVPACNNYCNHTCF